MKRALLLAFVSALVTVGLAQSSDLCQSYERDLELYFQVYQPGERPSLDWLDQAWIECRNPGLNFRLLYHYFKAMQSLYEQDGVTEVGYRVASFHQEQIQRNIGYLDENTYRSAFPQQFRSRSEALNKTLAAQAQVLDASARMAAKSAREEEKIEFVWVKSTPEFDPRSTQTGPATRGQQDPATAQFNKRYQVDGSYQEENPWQQAATEESNRRLYSGNTDEPFGVVGNIDQIDFYEYLSYRSGDRSATSASANNAAMRTRSQSQGTLGTSMASVTRGLGAPAGAAASTTVSRRVASSQTLSQGETLVYRSPSTGTTRSLSSNAPGSWVASLGGNYAAAVSLVDPLVVRLDPSFTGVTIARLNFGDVIALDKASGTVVASGMPFVHVRTQSGEDGWVERMALIEGGRLAVCTQNAQGYSRASTDGRPTGLQAGQLVLLAATEGNWVKVFTLNGASEVWLPSVSPLSIKPIDIALGEGLLEADKMPTDEQKRSVLNSLRSLNGYQGAALRGVVESRIR